MQIRLLAPDSDRVVRECRGPLAGGICPLMKANHGRMPCAGCDLVLKVGIGRPTTWLIRVAADAEECPVYVLNGAGFAHVA